MINNKTRYLQQIATDDNARSSLVEDLRFASALLTGESRCVDEAHLVRCSFRLARRLREVAQRLCDHARINSDDTCRYCEGVVEEPQ